MAKQVKDFSPEERQLILKDAEELGLQKAADKHGTTWQAVCSMRRIAEGKPAVRNITPEERERIWKRAGEVGFAQAAAENNLKEDTIKGWQWKYDMKMRDNAASSEANEIEGTQEIKKNKRPKEYAPETRAMIVEQAKTLGLNQASKKFGVSKESIRIWRKKMDEAPASTQAPTEEQPTQQTQQPSVQEAVQPQDLNHHDESVDTVVQNVESAVPIDATASATTVDSAAITDNTESRENSDNKPAPAIEAQLPVDSKASDLIALVQELRTEVAVLKERNAVLSHNLEVLKKAMQELLS